MKTKMTVVVDNIPFANLEGEWGLSIFIEYGNKKILLDTGGSQLFAENMKALGCNITQVDYGVLSHGHYDHAGGMKKFFEENKEAKFFIRETTKANCYKRVKLFKEYIGIPRDVLDKYSDRIEKVSGDYKLCDGVYLIPHKTRGLENVGRREKMYQKHGLRLKADNFSHEQSLVLETDKGLVIFNSCSHGGAGNIIREIKETFPDKHIYGMVGGMHLYNKTAEEVKRLADDIKSLNIEYICTGHCTKEEAYEILNKELGGIDKLRVGLKKEF